MITLLVVIYATFISLGLPNAMLGTAWPMMQPQLAASLETAGYLSTVIFGSTIVSALVSARLIARFGPAKVTLFSVGLMAVGLLGFSLAPSVAVLYLCAIPLGLGTGCVDAALNNFVAVHYQARHMNWLHCFWGLGATLGPMVLTLAVKLGYGWRGGYLAMAVLEAVLVIALLASIPLWKRAKTSGGAAAPVAPKALSNRAALRLPNVKLAMVTFIFFCATENVAGLWGSSFLTGVRTFSPETAALVISAHYAAITAGRFLAGLLAGRCSDETLIRWGEILCALGALATMLPGYGAAVGMVVMGLGISPIYPCLLHATPARFGVGVSQSIIGLEMAFAYIGSTFAPPLFGFVATRTTINLFPWFMLLFITIMLISSELLRKRLKKAGAISSM